MVPNTKLYVDGFVTESIDWFSEANLPNYFQGDSRYALRVQSWPLWLGSGVTSLTDV